ncbi:MAG TPA: hypothetical protein VMB22_02370 [Verrucomicrobiae bacterium]|nr:hypothetical protein [Verrucomicrobiae bacterium]
MPALIWMMKAVSPLFRKLQAQPDGWSYGWPAAKLAQLRVLKVLEICVFGFLPDNRVNRRGFQAGCGLGLFSEDCVSLSDLVQLGLIRRLGFAVVKHHRAEHNPRREHQGNQSFDNSHTIFFDGSGKGFVQITPAVL